MRRFRSCRAARRWDSRRRGCWAWPTSRRCCCRRRRHSSALDVRRRPGSSRWPAVDGRAGERRQRLVDVEPAVALLRIGVVDDVGIGVEQLRDLRRRQPGALREDQADRAADVRRRLRRPGEERLAVVDVLAPVGAAVRGRRVDVVDPVQHVGVVRARRIAAGRHEAQARAVVRVARHVFERR